MGELVTAKADVYSFAMIMWELLQSEIPYADLLFGESVPESLRKQVPTPNFSRFLSARGFCARGIIDEWWQAAADGDLRQGSEAARADGEGGVVQRELEGLRDVLRPDERVLAPRPCRPTSVRTTSSSCDLRFS